MARTIDTIYSEIIAAKEAESGLDSLNSTSAFAIWKLWAYITAVAIFTLETFFDLFKSEVDGIIAVQKPGTLLWYRAMCLGYKPGVPLVVDNGQVGYSGATSGMPALIAQCSVREAADGLVIKVAKEVSGELQPLDQTELNSFSAFLSAIKYAGAPIRIINSPAELLKIYVTIYYDPLLITPSGSLINSTVKPVEEAILSYLRNLPFDGRLKITALVENILSVKGVADVLINEVSTKYEQYPYEQVLVSRIPESGYFQIDNMYPLSSTITYQPYV